MPTCVYANPEQLEDNLLANGGQVLLADRAVRIRKLCWYPIQGDLQGS